MKKKTRRTISILVIILILFVILYAFNIFGLKYLIKGISVNTVTSGDTTITTTTGKSLDLPKEFNEHAIKLLDGDKIISIIHNVTENETQTIESWEVMITTDKSIDDIFDYYSLAFSNPITTKNETNAIIIGGMAENMIKVTIENGTYKIYMEKK